MRGIGRAQGSWRGRRHQSNSARAGVGGTRGRLATRAGAIALTAYGSSASLRKAAVFMSSLASIAIFAWKPSPFRSTTRQSVCRPVTTRRLRPLRLIRGLPIDLVVPRINLRASPGAARRCGNPQIQPQAPSNARKHPCGSTISEDLNMNSVAELLSWWALVTILIALSFPLFMFSLGFVIKTSIDKALAGKLKEIKEAVIELQHIRDDLKVLEQLNKLDQLQKLDSLDVLKNSWLLNS